MSDKVAKIIKNLPDCTPVAKLILKDREINELKQQLKQTQDRLKDAEDALSKYADVNNWSYQQIIDDISEVNGSLEGGADAREYFKKYGESDE